MKPNFVILFFCTLIALSCTNPPSPESSLLVNTWIFNGGEITTNKTGYFVSDARYDKYKYMDLHNNGSGSLWGGAAILDGNVSWDEKGKFVELQAKNDGGALLNFEKYEIDSVSSHYLKLSYSETHSDTVISKEILFKR